jgi:hypothetical protein
MKPNRIVELGTHYGFSYFSFCQAVAVNCLSTDCFAVDTWAGDEHAGYYDDIVYSTVEEENKKYSSFSTLLRKTFAEALEDIEDNSVDILHVDGRHFYDDVKEDFLSWVPKLSNRAVVLFHDTEVRERGFGVWRFWSEVASDRPSINFLHEHGLGVLFWGDQISDELAPFVSLIGTEHSRSLIANYFEIAGESFFQKKWIEEQFDSLNSVIANERQSAEKYRRENVELAIKLNATGNDLDAAKNALRVARKKPLAGIKDALIHNIMRRVGGITSTKFPNFSRRAERSAGKRDPNRDTFR